MRNIPPFTKHAACDTMCAVRDKPDGDQTGLKGAPREGFQRQDARQRQHDEGKPEPEIVVRASAASRTKPTGPDLSGLRRLSPNAKPARVQRDINFGRVGAFLFAALVVVVLPWFIVSRLGTTHHAAPKASSAPGPRVSVSAPAVPSRGSGHTAIASDAGTYRLVGNVACVHVRTTPSVHAEQLNCIKPGVTVTSDGQIKEADGYAWLHMEDPYKHLDGWVATKYVQKIRGTATR